ncbi:hypothetical protein ACLOJK_023098 [Asimina triloba]
MRVYGLLMMLHHEQAAREEDVDDDNMDGSQSDEEDDEYDTDKEMGDDGEGDEADSLKLQKLAAQAKAFQPNDDDDDSDEDYSDDEDLQSPIDEVDPFIFFVDTVKAIQATNLPRFQSLMQKLDFQYQARASGVAQHAEQRRVELEKEKLEKPATSGCGNQHLVSLAQSWAAKALWKLVARRSQAQGSEPVESLQIPML